MNATKILVDYSSEFKFDDLSTIPDKLVQESFQSEFNAALKNTNTYWDNFKQNIQRSNVLKALVERNVARKRVSRR